MVDVFISYKRDQRERCEVVAKKLEALGLEVWFDAKLESGKSFDVEIEQTLTGARAVLVLWSTGAVQSEWVRSEATVAKDRGILVAAMIESCTVPLAFTNVQTEQLPAGPFPNNHPAWLKLLKRIGELCRRPGVATYSLALGDASDVLKRWASENSGDLLSRQADGIVDALLGTTKVKRSVNWVSVLILTTFCVALPTWLAAGLYYWRESSLWEALYRTLSSLSPSDFYFNAEAPLAVATAALGLLIPGLFLAAVFQNNISQFLRGIFR